MHFQCISPYHVTGRSAQRTFLKLRLLIVVLCLFLFFAPRDCVCDRERVPVCLFDLCVSLCSPVARSPKGRFSLVSAYH